jgi:LytS/YehU family sensor histidine kinase
LLLVHLGFGIALTFLHDLATTFVLFAAGGGAITDFAPISNRWLMHIARNPFPATYAVVAGITWLFVSGWKLERERTVQARLESERRRLESKVLEQSLQPHLLFNALQAIGLRNHQASGDLQRLADYLRMILDGRNRDLVQVDVERYHLQVFLDLARVRFADRDLVEVVLEPGCEAMRVPSFSFQTLVENALQHGDKGEKVRISIARGSVRVRNRVRNRVRSGEAEQPGWGIGLSTLRSRLDVHFGGQATLALKSDGTHCEVEMILPIEEPA